MALPNKKDLKKNAKPAAEQPEVITPKVVKELPLEKVIENKLAENNVTKRVLNAMKDKYLVPAEGDTRQLKEEFVLKNNTDKETYLAIKAERKNVRKVGIITEDLCKKGREKAIQEQKLWLGKEKEVLGEVATVQDLLDEQIKIFEDEEERLRVEEEDRKDKQLVVRQNELIKMGAVNANGCMNINDLSIENSSIREFDDDGYQKEILPLFKMHYENNEKDRIEKEEEQKRQDDLRKKQQEELQQQQDTLKKQQEELDNQKRQFEQQQQQMKDQKIKSRKLQLEVIGLAFSLRDDAYTFEDLKVTSAEITDLDEVAWETRLQNLKPAIDQRKAAAKEKEDRKQQRSAQLSSLGMTFTGSAHTFEDLTITLKDLTDKDDTQWSELITDTTTKIADLKQKAQEKQQQEWQQQQDDLKKKQQQQQEEEAAKASDKDKWTGLLTAINAIQLPEMKSPAYKAKLNSFTSKIKEINAL